MRKFFPVLVTGLAVSFSQIAYSQIVIRGRGVTGDVQNSQSPGSGSQTNQQQGTGNQAGNTSQSGGQNQNTQQYGGSNKSDTSAGSTGGSSTGASGSYDNGEHKD